MLSVEVVCVGIVKELVDVDEETHTMEQDAIDEELSEIVVVSDAGVAEESDSVDEEPDSIDKEADGVDQKCGGFEEECRSVDEKSEDVCIESISGVEKKFEEDAEKAIDDDVNKGGDAKDVITRGEDEDIDGAIEWANDVSNESVEEEYNGIDVGKNDVVVDDVDIEGVVISFIVFSIHDA